MGGSDSKDAAAAATKPPAEEGDWFTNLFKGN